MFASPLPRVMMGIGLFVAIPAFIAVFTSVPPDAVRIEHWIAPLLVAFGSFKGAIATDTVLRMRNPEAREQLIQHHGSEAAIRAWLIYKFTAATLALLVAAYLALRLTSTP